MQAHVALSSAERLAYGARLSSGAAELALILDQTQIAHLIDYLELISKWNAVYNLTSVRDPGQMVTHHLLDSLAVVSAYMGARQVLDVGAGAGLPGIVLAIWARCAQPAMRITLIDTVHKKTAFLTQVKAELGLTNVTVQTGRVEQLRVGTPFDVITSRAFAGLADFVNWSAHLLQPDGRFLALKGALPEAEMHCLPSAWAITGILPLRVPGLDAARHLITIQRQGALP